MNPRHTPTTAEMQECMECGGPGTLHQIGCTLAPRECTAGHYYRNTAPAGEPPLWECAECGNPIVGIMRGAA